MEVVREGFLPFAAPEIGEDEIAEVSSALRAGWVTTGQKTKQFEADFASFVGGGVHAVAVNSATAGLHLALEAIGIGPGDEVITTTHTFTATAEVIRYLGADPVFVDIDPSSLCIDVSAVSRALTRRTKAVIPVHFGGLAADVDALSELAATHGFKIIEDAAHALPTTLSGRLVGGLDSDATVFSFYANKTITTGEGGMLVTRDAALASRARVMRLHGINRDAFDRFTSRAPAWFYEVVAPGFKYNLTDIASSIGIHQLKKAYRFRNRRAEIADFYLSSLAGLPLLLPPQARNDDIHSWHLFVIQLTDGASVSRDAFIDMMFRAGVGCSVHYIPLHRQPYWRDSCRLAPDSFPVSDKVFLKSVSLPIYSKMTDADAERVTAAVRGILG